MINVLKRRLALRRDRQIIQHAQIFRADWYANEYPDVPESAALDHYLNHGAHEGRNPNADLIRCGMDKHTRMYRHQA